MLLFQAAALGQTPAPPHTQPTSFTVGDSPRSFDSRSALGHYLAIHVLPGTRSEATAKLLRNDADKLPTLAGVRHIFIQAGTPEEFATTLTGAPAALRPSLFHDADASLARTLAIPRGGADHAAPGSVPALILLDPTGVEIARVVGKDDADVIAFSALAVQLAERTKDKETAESNLDSGTALQGYDPVAYLDQQKAVPGDKAIHSTYRSVRYRFASTANRDTFNADPAKYLPAYGGWCATAMAKGEKVEVDPTNFKVTGGRLFLFYKSLFGNALTDWNKDEPGLTTKADARWRQTTTGK